MNHMNGIRCLNVVIVLALRMVDVPNFKLLNGTSKSNRINSQNNISLEVLTNAWFNLKSAAYAFVQYACVDPQYTVFHTGKDVV